MDQRLIQRQPTLVRPRAQVFDAIRALIALLVCLVSGCGGVQKHPVDGRLGPFPIKTTVDSPIAKRHLEGRSSAEERAELKALKEKLSGQLPTPEVLRALAARTSVDHAATFFGERLLEVPKNLAAHRVYFHYLSLGERAITTQHRDEYVVILVPGYDHIETGAETGASLTQAREILAKVKMKTLFVELNPVGGVEENAAIIARLIRDQTSPTQKVVISGASSGGAAIHYALGSLLTPREAERVRGWINLGGIMRGSRMIDWFNSSWRYPFFRIGLWFTRWNATSLISMSTARARDRLKRSALAPHLVVLNFLGLSLSGSITDSEFSQYGFMRDWGPNDGFSLLPEMILPDTLTVIAPECDHFFGEDPFIHLKALALLATVIDLAENRSLCERCWRDDGPFPSFAFGGQEPLDLNQETQDWSTALELYRQLPSLSELAP